MAEAERPTEAAKEDAVEPVVAEEPTKDLIENETSVEDTVAPSVDQAQSSPEPTVREIRVERKGGFLPMVAGGILAAAAGYGVATFFPVLSQPADQTEAVVALDGRLKQLESRPDVDPVLAERMTQLEGVVAALPAPEPAPDLSDMTTALSDFGARLTALETQVSALAAMPTDGSGVSSAAINAAVESLRKDIEDLKGANAAAAADLAEMAADAEAKRAAAEADAEKVRAEAEAAMKAAIHLSALGRIKAAMESGAPFADALSDLEGYEIPPPLVKTAEAGVPSVATLADAFPEQARAALEASVRANIGESWGDRVTAFLQTTTGARSLTPREGTDPDAVLSRAEAAAKAGDFPTALAEIMTLPEVGQAAMAGWIADVQMRMNAQEAVAALSATVEG